MIWNALQNSIHPILTKKAVFIRKQHYSLKSIFLLQNRLLSLLFLLFMKYFHKNTDILKKILCSIICPLVRLSDVINTYMAFADNSAGLPGLPDDISDYNAAKNSITLKLINTGFLTGILRYACDWFHDIPYRLHPVWHYFLCAGKGILIKCVLVRPTKLQI